MYLYFFGKVPGTSVVRAESTGCWMTLTRPIIYSSYIYIYIKVLRKIRPEVKLVTPTSSRTPIL